MTFNLRFGTDCLDTYRRAADKKQIPRLKKCLLCGGKLHWHGQYTRWADDPLHNQRERIPILRLLCTECGTTISLIPSFIRPRLDLVGRVREWILRRYLAGSLCGAWQQRSAGPRRLFAA